MTTKFYMYTNPIGPNKKVLLVSDVATWDFENLKERFKNYLSKEGQDTVKLNLTTTLSEIHYDIHYVNLADFIEQISLLYPIKTSLNEDRLNQLEKELAENNIKFFELNSSRLNVTFDFFDKKYKFVIYLNEEHEFLIDCFINGSYEETFNGYSYDDDFEQPHAMTYYDDNDQPFTIKQIVTVMKIIDELERKIAKLKNDLPL